MGSSVLLAPEQKVVLEPDLATARTATSWSDVVWVPVQTKPSHAKWVFGPNRHALGDGAHSHPRRDLTSPSYVAAS